MLFKFFPQEATITLLERDILVAKRKSGEVRNFACLSLNNIEKRLSCPENGNSEELEH